MKKMSILIMFILLCGCNQNINHIEERNEKESESNIIEEVVFNDNGMNEVISQICNNEEMNLAIDNLGKIEMLSIDYESIISYKLKNEDVVILNSSWSKKNNEIKSIDDIAILTGLESLTVNRQPITTLDGAKIPAKLVELDLYGTNLEHIINKNGLEGIKLLNIGHTKMENIDVLERLENLEWFRCSSLKLNQQKLKISHPNIKFLDLGDLSLIDLNLEGCNNLEVLNVRRNMLTDDSFLAGVNLKKLDIQSNSLIGIGNIGDLDSLENINISYNEIANIDQLFELPNITEIKAEKNSIEEISITKRNEFLEILYLGDNSLSDVEEIYLLPNLIDLSLSLNEISDFDGIILKKLKKLDLDFNEIESIDFIGNLDKLEQLSLMGNEIKDINKLESNTLNYLSIMYCGIDSLEFIMKCPELVTVNVEGNNIDNIEVFYELDEGKSMVVNLIGNPITNSITNDVITSLKKDKGIEIINFSEEY